MDFGGLCDGDELRRSFMIQLIVILDMPKAWFGISTYLLTGNLIRLIIFSYKTYFTFKIPTYSKSGMLQLLLKAKLVISVLFNYSTPFQWCGDFCSLY